MPLARCVILKQSDGKFTIVPYSKALPEEDEEVGAVQVGLTLGQALDAAKAVIQSLPGAVKMVTVNGRSG